jgi:hypothetical protein
MGTDSGTTGTSYRPWLAIVLWKIEDFEDESGNLPGDAEGRGASAAAPPID